MDTCLDSLELTADEIKAAKREVEEAAYYKWKAAGCSETDDPLIYWLQAELEWIEYRYVPDRYPALHCEGHWHGVTAYQSHRPAGNRTSGVSA